MSSDPNSIRIRQTKWKSNHPIWGNHEISSHDSKFDAIKLALEEQNPQAILLTGFEKALVGYTESETSLPVACYSYEKCLDVLMKRDKMSRSEAQDYNVLDGQGEHSPTFLYDHF